MKKFLFALCFFTALQAQADHLRPHLLFSARLDGAQQVPAVTTDAKGIASFVLNNTRDTLFVNASFIGLSGSVTGVHLHTGAAGATGGVAIDLMSSLSGNKVTGFVTGANLTNNMVSMLTNNLYLNVHTAANPNGEIRGQVKLETDWHYSADLSGANEVPAVTTSAYGLGSFNLSLHQGILRYHIVCQGLSGAITGAHLHFGAAGSNGAVTENLTTSVVGNVIMGSLTPSAATLDSLMAGKIYINVHTAANPNGEIRAQLTTKMGLSFDGNFTGAQEVPAVTTTANAVGSFYVNNAMDTLWYHIVADGMSGAITGAHFHDGAAGANGAVAHNITTNISGNRIQGFVTGTGMDAAYITRLLGVNAYVNLHTAANPNGEIRSQVVRLAREGYTINMSSDQNTPATTNSAYGSGIVSISREQDNAHYMWVAGDLSGTPTSAHFHLGVMAASGGVLYDFMPVMVTTTSSAAAYGYWKSSDATAFTTANSVQFRNDSVYVNIHTAANPNGEIRGQVLRGSVMYMPVAVESFAFEVAEMLLYPNPAQDYALLQISNIKSDKLNINVTDINGRILQQQSIQNIGSSHQTVINVADFAAGIYFINITDGKNSTTERLIKH
jgi:hypothetical protein